MSKHPLSGTECPPYKGAKAVGNADPSESLQVTLVLRSRDAQQFSQKAKQFAGGDESSGRISREEFANRFGADPNDVAAVKALANEYGLSYIGDDPARRTVRLSGTVQQFNNAFGVNLQRFEYPGGSYRGCTGPVHVPPELANVVEAVLGLDTRPAARAHFRQHAGPAAFTPPQVASLYQFPAAPPSGRAQCIALIELGGGYNESDLSQYFAGLNVPMPAVTAVPVDGATNSPTGDPSGPDGEVMLDIEIAGSIAPAAHLAVYFAPNTDAGFYDAVTTAIHDTTNKPSVVSISWGSAESTWSAQTMSAFNTAFQAAATMGVTVTVASGDNGSSDGVSDNSDHVDFPASSTYALACGGTTLQGANGAITQETVWNETSSGEGATGGGVSTVFPVPAWQSSLHATTAKGQVALANRGVPDVSGNADPQTGYAVRVDGSNATYGGTSAVAPLWAALVALVNAAGPADAGFINPKIYANPGALNDVTSGNNGDFLASPGWDACTGLGSPNGRKISSIFAAAGSAGSGTS